MQHSPVIICKAFMQHGCNGKGRISLAFIVTDCHVADLWAPSFSLVLLSAHLFEHVPIARVVLIGGKGLDD